ncbi:MAG: hypothetical protein WED81_06915, partial [Rhodothermales bacterium]
FIPLPSISRPAGSCHDPGSSVYYSGGGKTSNKVGGCFLRNWRIFGFESGFVKLEALSAIYRHNAESGTVMDFAMKEATAAALQRYSA